MKLSEFQTRLKAHPEHELTFILPDGGRIPTHAHITEIGRVDKSFIDCGGTIRSVSAANLQAWVADDVEHRFAPGDLAKVLEKSRALFRGYDLDVEIEYEDGFISQFPVLEAGVEGRHLLFRLGTKHTDCLAKDVCLANEENAETAGACCGGGGCC
jgi:hypothetical protein